MLSTLTTIIDWVQFHKSLINRLYISSMICIEKVKGMTQKCKTRNFAKNTKET